jgi:hypothetical protein
MNFIGDVRFEVFTAVTLKNGVFWDVMLCGSCKNRRFGGTYAPIIRVTRIGELGTTLAVTKCREHWMRVMANIVPSSPIFVTLMMEALSSPETSVLTRPHDITSQKMPLTIADVAGCLDTLVLSIGLT